MSRTAPQVTLPDLLYTYYTQMMGSRQKTQPNPPEQQKINQKKHRTQTKGAYPNPKKANKLKKDSPKIRPRRTQDTVKRT